MTRAVNPDPAAVNTFVVAPPEYSAARTSTYAAARAPTRKTAPGATSSGHSITTSIMHDHYV
jgi:hypothetical protein